MNKLEEAQLVEDLWPGWASHHAHCCVAVESDFSILAYPERAERMLNNWVRHAKIDYESSR